ncbi:MAG: thioredoxin family protein [Anaerolineales bacterium]|nr:thioredoxin family protein [Anaerolineales bacterium]
MDKDFFYQGETIEEFLANQNELSDKYQQHIAEVQLGEGLLARLAEMPANLKVMVIAEPWSGDVLYYFPVLIRMAEEAGWEVRIFRRDSYPELVLPYRKDGLYHSIPVFVFYDAEFNEVAHWIERPAEATRVIDEESLKLRRRLREEHKAEWRQQTIKELVELFNS